ncbi:DNA-3-methyladenine glycosylase-like [Oopsacas minuta]|uniref:DNA-3-methyladenine glycosylase n=1 Tax=Oopsacas minuta TaxID=111878 RepID=A0AAV7JV13_9METZ|nr:DNA-3-methyladenine glycosylase-like [Oopsacas minuta]
MATKRTKLTESPIMITEENFFNQDCDILARNLLGCTLVSVTDKGVCSGKIVETEAYLGGEDKGAHSYGGKRTAKNESMFLPPGTSYVYHIYGMYCCYNVSAKGEGAAVLVRALEPVKGKEIMTARREKNRKTNSSKIKVVELCNGPSKLTQALGITKAGVDRQLVTTSDLIWIENRSQEDYDISILSGPRIGIDYAGPEWSMKPLRFYINDNPFVSVPRPSKSKKKK